MKRRFERRFAEDDAFQVRERLKIGVLGTGRGAGASFLAASLALRCAARQERAVAFAELPDGIGGRQWLYDSVGIDRRFAGRSFVPVHRHVAEGRYIREARNMDSRVNWALCPPADRGLILSELQQARLLNNLAGDLLIADLGAAAAPALLQEMDRIVCVIDPKPSRLIGARAHYQQMRRLQENGWDVRWVINKYSDAVLRRCFRDYIRVREIARLPLLKEIHFYRAEYHCRFPLEQREIENAVGDLIDDIVKELALW